MFLLDKARVDALCLMIEKAKQNKKEWDTNLNMKTKFKEGDWVIIQTKQPKKYKPHWYGLYKVVRLQLFGTYELETLKGIKYYTLIYTDRMVKARVEGRTIRGWQIPSKRGRPSNDTAERDEHIISYAPAPDND